MLKFDTPSFSVQVPLQCYLISFRKSYPYPSILELSFFLSLKYRLTNNLTQTVKYLLNKERTTARAKWKNSRFGVKVKRLLCCNFRKWKCNQSKFCEDLTLPILANRFQLLTMAVKQLGDLSHDSVEPCEELNSAVVIDNLHFILRRIENASKKAEQNPYWRGQKPSLVAVSKKKSPSLIQ